MKQKNFPIRLNSEHVFEIKEWVRRTINETEMNGDISKRNQSLALRAELP